MKSAAVDPWAPFNTVGPLAVGSSGLGPLGCVRRSCHGTVDLGLSLLFLSCKTTTMARFSLSNRTFLREGQQLPACCFNNADYSDQGILSGFRVYQEHSLVPPDNQIVMSCNVTVFFTSILHLWHHHGVELILSIYETIPFIGMTPTNHFANHFQSSPCWAWLVGDPARSRWWCDPETVWPKRSMPWYEQVCRWRKPFKQCVCLSISYTG